MNATICPTITAESPPDFRQQLQRVLPFARRLHIDLTDGVFAQPRGVGIGEIYWPANIPVDLHVMYQKPLVHVQALAALRPQLIIVHAEADGDFPAFAAWLHRHGMEVGVALLPQTLVETIAPALAMIDHVLIFSGRLGHYGGTADLRLLSKVQQLRALKPNLEIGWDGGINASNARQLAVAGVDVLNVGGFIQHSADPSAAFGQLASLL
jgi:ribulose-phosphate 3-epimerase